MVFNMIRLNEILTDKDNRLIGESPKIIKTDVITCVSLLLTHCPEGMS